MARGSSARVRPPSGAPYPDGVSDSGRPSADGPLVFLGDSLTEGGPWESVITDRQVVNAGRGGDTTADVEDRVDGVVALGPAVVVLMVGTNDFGHRATVEQVVRGNENILFRLRHELPDAHLIVCSVLPRERDRAEWIRQVNIHVRQFAPTVKAEFLDLWPAFAEEDGELRPEFTVDRLHLTDAGYEAWLEQLRPLLD